MSAPPFPPDKATERGAALGFALGALALTATFGLRTAVFQVEYSAQADELEMLAKQGAAECLVALLLVSLALWPRSKRVAKAILITAAVAVTVTKLFFLLMVIAIGEPEPWAYSGAIFALAGLVSAPLILSFLPVVSDVYAARAANAHDAPLQVRATLCVWLACAGIATAILGPDLSVRLLGLLALGGAAQCFTIGSKQERRLSEWVRSAISQGPPAYFIEPEPPADDVPSVYAGDARRATILTAEEDAGSYRRDPSKAAIAAVDPEASLRPRRFVERVRLIAALPLVLTLIATAVGWLILHPAGLAPRPVTSMYSHMRVKPYGGYAIDGLTLWAIERGGDHVVGYDPATRRVIEGQELFRRVRGLPAERLAELANSMLYNGECCVLKRADPGWPKDVEGNPPKAPYVEGDKLVFWRKAGDKVYRFDAPLEAGMLAAPPAQ